MFELLRLAFVVFHWSFGSTTSNSKKQQTRSRFKSLNLRNRPNCLCFLTQNLLSLLCSLDKKVFRQRTFFFCLNGYVEVFAAGGKGKADSGKCGGGEKSAPRES